MLNKEMKRSKSIVIFFTILFIVIFSFIEFSIWFTINNNLKIVNYSNAIVFNFYFIISSIVLFFSYFKAISTKIRSSFTELFILLNIIFSVCYSISTNNVVLALVSLFIITPILMLVLVIYSCSIYNKDEEIMNIHLNINK